MKDYNMINQKEQDKDICPVCGCLWDELDFGVPFPICPSEPLPGKSWTGSQVAENL